MGALMFLIVLYFVLPLILLSIGAIFLSKIGWGITKSIISGVWSGKREGRQAFSQLLLLAVLIILVSPFRIVFDLCETLVIYMAFLRDTLLWLGRPKIIGKPLRFVAHVIHHIAGTLHFVLEVVSVFFSAIVNKIYIFLQRLHMHVPFLMHGIDVIIVFVLGIYGCLVFIQKYWDWGSALFSKHWYH